MTAAVLAVCRVARLRPDAGTVGVTAIDKRPVDGPVQVGELGLHADIQADRKNHGGPDKAVYVYAQEACDQWASEVGQIPFGGFGENLRTRGLDVDDAVIGERWRIGDGLVLEVTMPRIPCMTFARHLDQPQWVKRFTAMGLAGAYTRVVTRGAVAQDDEVQVIHRPDHGVTVRDWFTRRSGDDARALLAAAAAGRFRLADELRDHLETARDR